MNFFADVEKIVNNKHELLKYLFNSKKNNTVNIDLLVKYLNTILHNNEQINIGKLKNFVINFEVIFRDNFTYNYVNDLLKISIVRLFIDINLDNGLTSRNYNYYDKVISNVLKKLQIIKNNDTRFINEKKALLSKINNEMGAYPHRDILMDENFISNLLSYEVEMNKIIHQENKWRVSKNIESNMGIYKMVPFVKTFNFIKFIYEIFRLNPNSNEIYKTYNSSVQVFNERKERLTKLLDNVRTNCLTDKQLKSFDSELNKILDHYEINPVKVNIKNINKVLNEFLKNLPTSVKSYRIRSNSIKTINNSDIILTKKIFQQKGSKLNCYFLNLNNKDRDEVTNLISKINTTNIQQNSFKNFGIQQNKHSNINVITDEIFKLTTSIIFTNNFCNIINSIMNCMHSTGLNLNKQKNLSYLLNDTPYNVDKYAFKELIKYQFEQVFLVEKKYENKYLPVKTLNTQRQNISEFLNKMQMLRKNIIFDRLEYKQDKYFGIFLKERYYSIDRNKKCINSLGIIQNQTIRKPNKKNKFKQKYDDAINQYLINTNY
jgi:hypothetical protein